MQGNRKQSALNHLCIADGHVHIYDCYQLAPLFDTACENFAEQARRLGQSDTYSGVIFLAERSADRWFERLFELADAVASRHSATKPWTLHRVPGDARLLIARRASSEEIFVVAGRQIVSSEGLEVLTLATTSTLPDGLPAAEILQTAHQYNAISVLPWGVGKWLGRRGELLERLLKSDLGSTFFLGDNGGRPAFWATPSHFKLARSLGVSILPGTDPLPFTWEARRVGSFGFTLACPLAGTFCLQRDLIEPLQTRGCVVSSYGNLQSAVSFARNQIALRVTKLRPFAANE